MFQFVGRLVRVAKPIGPSVGQSIELLVGWLAGCLANFIAWLTLLSQSGYIWFVCLLS